MKKITLAFIFLLIGNVCIFSQSKNKDYTLNKIERYQNNAKGAPFFVPLEIGEITPRGWLLQWAKSAAKGITGHLDEYENVYKYGWKGVGFKARGANPDGTGWPLEQCSYWLDGAVKLGYILGDTTLIRKTSSRLNLVVNGVLNGGDTFVYWKPKSIVNDHFNNWAHALMGRVLVSYYQATHNPKILQALTKVYENFSLIVPTSEDITALQSGMEGMRGTTNIDAMTETYLMSGNKAILDSIISFSNKETVQLFQNHWMTLNSKNPTIESEDVHGVSYYEVLRVPAMMSTWTANKNGLKATEHMISWGENKNELPFGVCSSEEYLAGVGSFRNAETCDVPTSMWSFLWMLRLTGESKWSDKIEKEFFNAGPAPVARDFKTMCYYQSPNRISTALPEEPPIPGRDCLKFTKFGHEVLCCVGNLNNVIPDYISNMWMVTMDKGLAATLYGPCSVSKNINGINLKINCNTSYPFDEKIYMNLLASKNINMPIYFRIPDWCKNAKLFINNRSIAIKSINGFVKVERLWKNNDKIMLVFPMIPKVIQGRETPYPQVTYFLKGFQGNTKAAVDTTVNNPFECVTYGPLLFSLPIKDINPNQESKNAKFNYALNINSKQLKTDIKVFRKPMAKEWTWKIEDAPIQLKVKAKEFNWVPTQMQPLSKTLVTEGISTTINLIPYGCTKFRVTMFPVTKETWIQ